MTEKKAKHPWRGWKPSSAKEYDPKDTHVNLLHLPKGYPQDLLEAEWAEPDVTEVEETLPDGSTRKVLIFKRKERDD